MHWRSNFKLSIFRLRSVHCSSSAIDSSVRLDQRNRWQVKWVFVRLDCFMSTRVCYCTTSPVPFYSNYRIFVTTSFGPLWSLVYNMSIHWCIYHSKNSSTVSVPKGTDTYRQRTEGEPHWYCLGTVLESLLVPQSLLVRFSSFSCVGLRKRRFFSTKRNSGISRISAEYQGLLYGTLNIMNSHPLELPVHTPWGKLCDG